jgi:hypothetical protein
MNREDAVWYYRLGGQTLGPVSWAEIEEVTEDAVDADRLLVAQAGDSRWVKASQAMTERPDLGEESGYPTEPESEQDWGLVEEGGPEPQSAGWVETEPAPSAAASDVLGAAAVERDTGRPAPKEPGRRGAYPDEMPRRHGIGAWIGQAWEMVTGEPVAFIFGTVLAGAVTVLTLGLAGPPMQAGLFVMAVKRFQNKPISAGTVFEGFNYILPAWGVVLLQMLIGGIAGAAIGGGIGAVLGAAGADQQTIASVGQTIGYIVNILVAAALFYAMVLVVNSGVGPLDAIGGSWEMTKDSYASYVGMTVLLQLVASAGALACGVGVLLTAPMLPCAVVAAYMYHARKR